ncbi:cupin domain-containing protein [Natronomonas salina]|nr:cupin domain-containing protein [Natronomonas salina]
MAVGRLPSPVPNVTSLSDLESTPHANLFPGDEPKTIRLSLGAGEAVPPHRHPDRQIVLHLLEGTVELALGDDVHELEAGEVIRFDGDQEISPTAVTDATALLVLAPRVDD